MFPFTTDVPFLDRWGTPLLFGPGSFLVAHTDGEFVTLDELHAAVDGFERLARGCSPLAGLVLDAVSGFSRTGRLVRNVHRTGRLVRSVRL